MHSLRDSDPEQEPVVSLISLWIVSNKGSGQPCETLFDSFGLKLNKTLKRSARKTIEQLGRLIKIWTEGQHSTKHTCREISIPQYSIVKFHQTFEMLTDTEALRGCTDTTFFQNE